MGKVLDVVFHPICTLTQTREKVKTNKFLRGITIEKIDGLNGYDFETLVGAILQNCGFKCEVTRKSKDNGADIIAEKRGIKMVIQAKLYYKHNGGNKGVQEVYTAKNMFCGQVAVVVTNSYFSKSAIETAAKCDVVLIDRDMLGKLIKNNSRQNEELFDQIIYEKLKRNI